MLNVIVVCKEPKAPGGLQYAGPHNVVYCTAEGWGRAANAGLAEAARRGGDALMLDDDTQLVNGSLVGVREHYAEGDIFGLDLHDLSGARQVGARHILTEDGALEDWVHSGPAYVAHVSTSAVYLKASVLALLRFPEWPGIHYEDVKYCLEAWALGLRVLAVPGYVHHAIVGGVGASRAGDPRLVERLVQNGRLFDEWWGGQERKHIPIGAREL